MNNDSIIGKKFNMLTVISKSKFRNASRTIKYKCICECGNITYATKCELKTGHKKSCGCYRRSKISDGIIGKKFGYLTVLEYLYTNKNGRAFYKCKCACGNEVVVRSDCLKTKNNISCGCKQKKNAKVQAEKMRFADTNVKFLEGALKNNKSKRAISGIKGVYYDKRRKSWYAKITFKKRDYYLGAFGSNKEKAIEAREEAEQRLFRNFLDWYKNKYEK